MMNKMLRINTLRMYSVVGSGRGLKAAAGFRGGCGTVEEVAENVGIRPLSP
jgi:hypothetical protein